MIKLLSEINGAEFATQKKQVKVKSYTRKGRLIKSYSQERRLLSRGKTNSKSKEKDEGFKKAALAGAGFLGLSATTYLGLRLRYRAGIAQSAELAKVAARKIQVPDSAGKAEQLTFLMGGFTGKNTGEGGANAIKYLLRKELKSHALVPVKNKGFDILIKPKKGEEDLIIIQRLNKRRGIGRVQLQAEFAGKSIRKMLQKTIIDGRNQAALDLAANAYAYSQRFPGKPVNLIGHSAGGMITTEAAEILKRMGVETRLVNLGSPYFGLTEKVGRQIHITSRKDLIDYLPKRDSVYINSVSGHGVTDYLKDAEVLRTLKNFLSL